MELRGTTQLSVLLIVTLLFCHGALGGLHLVCLLPGCADHGHYAAKYQPTTGGLGDAHEHPAGHETSIEYFAVLVGLLGLLLRLLPKLAPSRGGLSTPRAEALRRLPVAFHLPSPKPPNLQVFTL
ncbi:MAG TPA: hypothetical protein VHM69_17705 [Rubrobacter sp.]|nr:hypothetical protein [Rubrobacter sp.]